MESYLLGLARFRSIGRFLAQNVDFGRSRNTYMCVRQILFCLFPVMLLTSSLSASVNPDGSYGQKIQVEAIAGKNGLTPRVEPVYHSNGGNGVAGVGWSLGFRPITRTANRTIHYDSTDFFVGPNGKLSLVNGEYKAQNQDWSRYLPQGQIGYGPASWVVKPTEDGMFAFIPAHSGHSFQNFILNSRIVIILNLFMR